MESINVFYCKHYILYIFLLNLMLSCLFSESVLELSIMPKDDDVLQLVSVRLSIFTFSHTVKPNKLS